VENALAGAVEEAALPAERQAAAALVEVIPALRLLRRTVKCCLT
jgi:hypothetical protein